MRFKPEDWFGPKRPMTIGCEVELVLYDAEMGGLLTKERFWKAEKVFKNLPDKIWKDYYPYQLEIRTGVHKNPQSAINEIVELYKMADAAFSKENLFIVPVPWVGIGDDSYCGMHVHVRYLDEKENNSFFEKTWGAYPFILAIADHTKNAESNTFNTSARISNSHHIKMPYVDTDAFNIGTGEHRWKDITPNRLKQADNPDPKKTLKSVSTLETRIFDTPSLMSHLQFIVESTYNVFASIRNDNPIMKMGIQSNYDRFVMTRALMQAQRYGVNKILRDANFNICEQISQYFGIECPQETQFEFREQFTGLSNVDRKLVMRRYSFGK